MIGMKRHSLSEALPHNIISLHNTSNTNIMVMSN